MDQALDLGLPLVVVPPRDELLALKLGEDDIPDYKKSTADDLKSMHIGLFGFKGMVHFQTAACINDELALIDHSLSKPELFSRISTIIDKRIHSNYRIYPNNYVAYDLLEGNDRFAAHYTAEDKQGFLAYLDQQLARIEIPNKDEDFLREKILLMYVNPLKNYLAATNA